MQELDTKLKQLPAWELTTYPGELEAGRPPKSQALLVGSKPQKEDRGDVEKDGGHLYDRLKMLYKEIYEPKPVLIQGMEDTISIISNLFPPYLQHEFSYAQQSCPVTNVISIMDSYFSEHEGPPSPE